MKDTIKKYLKKPVGWLVLTLIITIVCSLCAALVNNSGFAYRVSTVTADIDELYDTDAGNSVLSFRKSLGDVDAKLTGNLYMPRDASKDNPKPCIILTHGYLNSKEFEEAPAIEMAKRGYVVFAFDQYDHGDSTWNTPAAFNFYVWSVYDAVQYMYSQDYVLKDANGNGMISVSGHSMGGFGSELAVAWDEMSTSLYGIQTYRKIAAVLAVGADFRYDDGYVSGYSGGTYDATYKTYNTRSAGTIYGEYDEFFFDNDSSQNTNGNTVIKKDYAKDSKGYGMLGYLATTDATNAYANKSNAKNNTWTKVDAATNVVLADQETTTAGYGERVLFKVAGDHPYNTWSPEATQRMIEFYDHAFTYQLKLHNLGTLKDYKINNAGGQTWWLKEVFTCIGLIAMVGAMTSGALVLADVPFLSKVKTKEEDIPEVTAPTKTRKGIAAAVSVLSICLSMYLIPSLMNRSGTGLTIVQNLCKALCWVALLVGVGLVVAWVVTKAKDGTVNENARKVIGRSAIATTTIALIAVVTKWMVTDGTSVITAGSKYYAAPSVNTIVFWAMVSGLVGLLFTLINHFMISENRTIAHLGLKANWVQVGVSALIAIAVAFGAWLVLMFTTYALGVDFRVYTYAFNTVTWGQFVVALRYIPLFFVFYLCAGMGIANATAGETGIKADVKAVLLEVLPCAIFLVFQYGRLLATGTAAYPSFALNGILVQGLIWTLVFLAVIQRRTLEKTGNIWTGVFLNTIWFTMITLASTAVYQLA